jgi:hypothetical protein
MECFEKWQRLVECDAYVYAAVVVVVVLLSAQ